MRLHVVWHFLVLHFFQIKLILCVLKVFPSNFETFAQCTFYNRSLNTSTLIMYTLQYIRILKRRKNISSLTEFMNFGNCFTSCAMYFNWLLFVHYLTCRPVISTVNTVNSNVSSNVCSSRNYWIICDEHDYILGNTHSCKKLSYQNHEYMYERPPVQYLFLFLIFIQIDACCRFH